MIVTLFDTFGGFSAYNTLIETDREPPIDSTERYRSLPILDNSLLIMPRSSRGVVMISRYSQRDNTITWIATYRSSPYYMSDRAGSYYGAGIFVADRIVAGSFVIRALEGLLDAVLANMGRDGAFDWRSKDVYDRALDAQPALGDLRNHLSVDPTSRGISPSASGCAGLNAESTSMSIGEILDAAQRREDFKLFQKLLIVRDDTSHTALNRRAVTMIDERGAPSGRTDWRRETRDEPSARLCLPAARPEPATWRSDAPAQKGDSERADPEFVDGHHEPRKHRVSLALFIGLINSAVLCVWIALQLSPYLVGLLGEGVMSSGQSASSSTPATTSNELRSGEWTAKTGNVRPPVDQQLRSVSDIVNHLMSDEVVLKTPSLKSQVEQMRDLLRTGGGPLTNRPEGPR